MTPEGFWARVDKSARPDGCWLWTGRAQRGYGVWRTTRGRGRRTVHRAHHFAWELVNGPVPDGLWVLHHCDNPPCIKAEPDDQLSAGLA